MKKPKHGRHRHDQSHQTHVLLAVDRQNSVLAELNNSDLNKVRYSAYGQRSAERDPAASVAFNGEFREPDTGWYLLGNGYRAYNPVLRRFHSPDSFSPFESGGLNAYAYCVGDPINHSDPTGHFAPGAFLRLVVPAGLAALGAGSTFAGLIAMVVPDSGSNDTKMTVGAVLMGAGLLMLSAGGTLAIGLRRHVRPPWVTPGQRLNPQEFDMTSPSWHSPAAREQRVLRNVETLNRLFASRLPASTQVNRRASPPPSYSDLSPEVPPPNYSDLFPGVPPLSAPVQSPRSSSVFPDRASSGVNLADSSDLRLNLSRIRNT